MSKTYEPDSVVRSNRCKTHVHSDTVHKNARRVFESECGSDMQENHTNLTDFVQLERRYGDPCKSLSGLDSTRQRYSLTPADETKMLNGAFSIQFLSKH